MRLETCSRAGPRQLGLPGRPMAPFEAPATAGGAEFTSRCLTADGQSFTHREERVHMSFLFLYYSCRCFSVSLSPVWPPTTPKAATASRPIVGHMVYTVCSGASMLRSALVRR